MREDLDEVIASYIEARLVGGVKEASAAAIRRALEDFRAFLSRREVEDLAEVDETMVQEYLAAVLERSAERAFSSEPWVYMNAYAYRLRPFFAWAMKTGRMLVHPMSADERPRLPQRLPRASLTPEEVRRLLEATDLRTNGGLRDRAMLEILYSSALRRAEVVKMDLRDWNADARTVLVREGKFRKDRMVPVGEVAALWLGRYLAEARPFFEVESSEQAFFLNRYGRRILHGWVSAMVPIHAKAAGLEKRVTPHMLRHACASHLVEAGADLRHVQELLGHSQISTTEVYTRLTQVEVAGAHRRFHPRATREA